MKRSWLIGLLMGIMVAGVVMGGDVVSAAGGTCPSGSLRGSYTSSPAECNVPPDESGNGLMNSVKNGINLAIGLVGVIAVVVIIIGGISFITSQGDAPKVTKARNTILYGIVGMVIAILSFAIVNFVLSGVFGGSSTPTTDTDVPPAPPGVWISE